MLELISPQTKAIKTAEGTEKEFILSKIPAIPMREIMSVWTVSAMPKVGNYQTNQQMMLKIMSFVAVKTDSGHDLRLTSEALVNNHVPDWETLVKLEWAMLEYNTSFLANGGLLGLIKEAVKNPGMLDSVIKTLTSLSGQSSQKDGQPSTS